MSLLKDVKSIFSKYNVALEVSEPEQEPVQLMIEGILADGSSVFTDSDTWAVGVRAFTKDAEGNNVPCVDGEYELADGGKLEIKDGLVAEISSKEEEQPEETAPTGETEMQEDMKALFEHITSLEAQIKALTDKNTSLSKQVTELSKQPAIASVKDKTNVAFASNMPASKPFSKMTYEEKVAFNINKFAKHNN